MCCIMLIFTVYFFYHRSILIPQKWFLVDLRQPSSFFIFPTSFLYQYILFQNCFMLFLVNISYLFFFPALRLFIFSFPFIYLLIYFFIYLFSFFFFIYFSSFKNKAIPWTSTAAFYKRLVERQGRRWGSLRVKCNAI